MTTPTMPAPANLAAALHEIYVKYNARLDDEHADRQSLLESLLDAILRLSSESEASTQDNQGYDYSRPIDNGSPAAAVPDGVDLIPVNGRDNVATPPPSRKDRDIMLRSKIY